MDIKVFDNFLEEDVFQEIESHIKKIKYWEVTYRLNPGADREEQFQFLHTIIEEGHVLYPEEIPLVRSIMKPLYRSGASPNVHRVRINMFIRISDDPVEMGYHEDWTVEDNPGIYSLLLYNEDSDGATQFKDGEKILSKRNRAILFDGMKTHQTVQQTSCLFRYNININFSDDGTQRLVEFPKLHKRESP